VGTHGCDQSGYFPNGGRAAIARGCLSASADGCIAPCIPTLAAKPPAGTDWVHEIKHDGYRLIVRRDGDSVSLFTRGGYDWSNRYPAITRAAATLRARSFTIDGDASEFGALVMNASSTARMAQNVKSLAAESMKRSSFKPTSNVPQGRGLRPTAIRLRHPDRP